MHRYLLLLPLFVSIVANAQTTIEGNENDILIASKKREGIYQNFLEFRRNSPSIAGKFKITDHHIKVYDSTKGRYANFKERFWGACVADTIYIFLEIPNVPQAPHIYAVPAINRYMYFTDSTKLFIGGNGGSYMYYDSESAATVASRGARPAVSQNFYSEYIVNINNGNIYKLNNKVMHDILEKYPGLLVEFKESKEQRKRYRYFIDRINEIGKNSIKPIDQLKISN